MLDGTRRTYVLTFAPDSPPALRASTIASDEVFLLSKWTVKSSTPAWISMLPTPSAPSNALLTAETQPAQMPLPSSNLALVSVATEDAAGSVPPAAGCSVPPASAGRSAVQPARMRAQTPVVINRIMVSLGKVRTPAGHPRRLNSKREAPTDSRRLSSYPRIPDIHASRQTRQRRMQHLKVRSPLAIGAAKHQRRRRRRRHKA